MTGNGIIRLKIKKAKNPAATINGYVFFDVGPKQNPFEVARDMVKSLSPGDIWNVCLIANDSGTIYNWDDIKTNDEVQLWAFDGHGSFAFHDDQRIHGNTE